MSKNNDDITENSSEDIRNKKKKVRFEWLDQFRGVVIILFAVQTLAWSLNGKPADLAAGLYPILPPWVNHGWRFAAYSGIPDMITLIDLGQAIFIFLVGFMQAFAVLKRKQKSDSDKEVWIHLIKRFLLIMMLNIVHMAASGDLDNVKKLLLTGTLAQIGWAGLMAGIVSMYIAEGDKRLIVGGSIMLVHSILYAINMFEPLSGVPFDLINHIAVAIFAAAFAQWVLKADGTVNEEGFKNRVLPVWIGSIVAAYLIGMIQWADHGDATTSHSSLAVRVSGLSIYTFYKMDKDGFHVWGLTAFGKNMLFIFLMEMILIELVYLPIVENLVRISPFLDLILFGILPILMLWVLAKLLEWKDIYIKV